jgi:hypothetical protein
VLAPGGRRLRLIATAATAVLLVAGTAWGEDDHFPFGPFKMYSRATKPDGRISWPRIDAVDASGRERSLRGADIGLRRAELEGQLPRFRRDPSLLGALADAYASRHPDRPPLVEVRLVKRGQRIVDSEPVGEPTEMVELVWQENRS